MDCCARLTWPNQVTNPPSARIDVRQGRSNARSSSARRSGEAIWTGHNLLERDAESIRGYLDAQRAELARTGTVPLGAPWRLYGLGLTEAAYELIDKASFAHMFERQGREPWGVFPGFIFSRTNEAFFHDRRFPRLCAKLGLCDYWIGTGKWPDCADEVSYDFQAEARRSVGAA